MDRSHFKKIISPNYLKNEQEESTEDREKIQKPPSASAESTTAPPTTSPRDPSPSTSHAVRNKEPCLSSETTSHKRQSSRSDDAIPKSKIPKASSSSSSVEHSSSSRNDFPLKTTSEEMDIIKNKVGNSKVLPFDSYDDETSDDKKKFSFDDYFQIGDKLDTAISGGVYKAIIKGTKNVVAVKMLSKSKVEASGMIKCVKMEADVHKRIRHPHIARFYAHFQDSENIYFVLEFAPRNMYHDMKSKPNGHYTESETAVWMAQLMDAIDFCHQNHIVHADVKMLNVMIDEKRRAKLIDFGMAHPCEPNSYLNERYGTPICMPPDVYSTRGFDKRVDIWSLGVLCYKCLTGKNPFRADKEEDIFKRIDEVIYCWPVDSSVSQLARQFVDKFLQKDVTQRITLKEALQHEWITTNNKNVKDSPTVGGDPERQFIPMTDKWWLKSSSAPI